MSTQLIITTNKQVPTMNNKKCDSGTCTPPPIFNEKETHKKNRK